MKILCVVNCIGSCAWVTEQNSAFSCVLFFLFILFCCFDFWGFSLVECFCFRQLTSVSLRHIFIHLCFETHFSHRKCRIHLCVRVHLLRATCWMAECFKRIYSNCAQNVYCVYETEYIIYVGAAKAYAPHANTLLLSLSHSRFCHWPIDVTIQYENVIHTGGK